MKTVMSGTYTDTFGEAFRVESVPCYGARTFYVVTSAADGTEHRASETLLREWVASGYFRRTQEPIARLAVPSTRTAADTSATVMIGGR